jgi:uncharacterized protein
MENQIASSRDHFMAQIPVRLRPILGAAMDGFQLSYMSLRGPTDSLHGPAHWLRVFHHATSLARQTGGTDLEVCELFALLHDCQRWNDGIDEEHGARASEYAKGLHRSGRLQITQTQLEVLCEACGDHTSGLVSTDPTIGVCWDADRLDLPRVGARVEKKYLSTAAAKGMLQI